MAGVLVAISIPIFTSQLEKSREAVDAANIRAGYAEAMSNYLTDQPAAGGSVTSDSTFTIKAKTAAWETPSIDWSFAHWTTAPTIEVGATYKVKVTAPAADAAAGTYPTVTLDKQ